MDHDWTTIHQNNRHWKTELFLKQWTMNEQRHIRTIDIERQLFMKQWTMNDTDVTETVFNEWQSWKTKERVTTEATDKERHVFHWNNKNRKTDRDITETELSLKAMFATMENERQTRNGRAFTETIDNKIQSCHWNNEQWVAQTYLKQWTTKYRAITETMSHEWHSRYGNNVSCITELLLKE